MVDLSKLPWGELKLPGDLVACSTTGDAVAAIYADNFRTMLLRRSSGGWDVASCASGASLALMSEAIDATKLVDTFILEHGKPKMPDVVPPEGCKWKDDAFGNPYVSNGDYNVAVPRGELTRDMYLACCEAAEPGMTSRLSVSLQRGAFGRFNWAIADDTLTVLPPGEYSVSFRRLP